MFWSFFSYFFVNNARLDSIVNGWLFGFSLRFDFGLISLAFETDRINFKYTKCERIELFVLFNIDKHTINDNNEIKFAQIKPKFHRPTTFFSFGLLTTSTSTHCSKGSNWSWKPLLQHCSRCFQSPFLSFLAPSPLLSPPPTSIFLSLSSHFHELCSYLQYSHCGCFPSSAIHY